MQLRSNWFVVSLAAFALAASTASAATVTYTLDLTVPGNFKVFAQTSPGDNGGLVTYGIPLMVTGGSVATLDHLSPNTAFATGPTGSGAAGFSFLRSADNSVDIAASQDTIAPTPNLIHGFGQTASSFAALNIVPVAAVEQATWDAKLLIAQGTYTGTLDFNRTSVNIIGDMFSSPDTTTIINAATINLMIDGGGGGVAPTAVDFNFGDKIQGGVVNHQFTTSAGDPPITWGGLVATGPGGASPSIAPTLGADGAFSWNSGFSALGTWFFDATATNSVGSDVGRLTVNIVVPEPATLSLLGLAMIGLVGFARRRG